MLQSLIFLDSLFIDSRVKGLETALRLRYGVWS